MPEAQSVHTLNLAWPLVAMAFILLANGFFVAVEFSVVTSRRTRLEQLALKGNAPARLMLKMLENPDRTIAASQLGITAASILLGIVAEEPLTRLLAPLLAPTLGRFLSDAAAAALAALLVLLILSFFHMVVGEQTPKIIAIRYPEQTGQVIAYPMRIFARITAPFVWVVDKTTGLLLHVLGVRGATGAHSTIASIDELKAIVRQSGKVGLLEEDAQEMVYRVFDFGERVVREVMVPRTNIIGIECTATVRELLYIFKKHRHSRFPVYVDDLDHIMGVLSIKRLLVRLVDEPDILSSRIEELDLVKEPMMVPESRLISDLFAEMRATQTALVIVIDEFGGTAGLVTIGELVEEVMGQITEEWSSQPLVRQIADNIFEVDAQMHVDEVNDALGFQLPVADDYETIAGLILYQLRRIPIVGQEISTPGYKIRVLELDGPKITKVRIEATSQRLILP